MLYETLKHGVIFLSMLYFGILGGILYEWKVLIVKLLQKKWTQRISDILFCVVLAVLFFLSAQFTNYGEIRAFLLFSFFLGFLLERISIGFWLAKLTKFLYNKLVLLFERIRC